MEEQGKQVEEQHELEEQRKERERAAPEIKISDRPIGFNFLKQRLKEKPLNVQRCA